MARVAPPSFFPFLAGPPACCVREFSPCFYIFKPPIWGYGITWGGVAYCLRRFRMSQLRSFVAPPSLWIRILPLPLAGYFKCSLLRENLPLRFQCSVYRRQFCELLPASGFLVLYARPTPDDIRFSVLPRIPWILPLTYVPPFVAWRVVGAWDIAHLGGWGARTDGRPFQVKGLSVCPSPSAC